MPDLFPTTGEARPSTVRYRVLAFFCLAAAIAYLQRMSVGVAAPQMRSALSLSEIEFGWILSGFYWAYGAFQIPAGSFGQRVGSRAGLTIYMLATSLLCALVALSFDFWSLLFVWMGVGVAIAGIFPCCAQSIVHWFPPTERAMPNGMLLSAMSVGAMVAAALTGWLLSFDAPQSLGDATANVSELAQVGVVAARQTDASTFAWETWRVIFVLYAVPGFLWAMTFGVWFRNRPDEQPGVNALELQQIHPVSTASDQKQHNPGPTPWGTMLLHPTMWFICGQQFFRAAGYGFYGTWFPTYLREVYGVTTATSGYLTSLPMLGVVGGGIVAGPLCDLILRRTGSHRLSLQLVGVLSMFICGVLILLAWFVESANAAVALITVGSFVFAFGSCTAYAVTIHVAQPYVAPTFSTMNMAGNVGAAACPVVVGWLATVLGWDFMLLFFALIYALACLCWMGLNPDRVLYAGIDNVKSTA